MIIDGHVHVFPDQAGDGVGRPAAEHRRVMQSAIKDYWGRMITSHQDPRFIPEDNEDVDFHVAGCGRWRWHKHGEDCWLQRGPPVLAEMEHTPEQVVASMDAIGVDRGVIHADFIYVDAVFGREHYFVECLRQYPDRLIGTFTINFDPNADERSRERELGAAKTAISNGFKALYVEGNMPNPLDHPHCDPLWSCLVEHGIPAYINTGFCERDHYLAQVESLSRLLHRYPDLHVIDSHFGGNYLHERNPSHTNLDELDPLLKTGRFLFELGYVLAFEHQSVWGADAEYPYRRQVELAQKLHARYGADVLTWGSDIPWCYRVCTYRQSLDSVRQHMPFLSASEMDKVLGGNLARVLQIT
tara:strand:- start:787 stop:1857 length:1071 start_codon:yes stop_codon:yes gene_type:complete